MRLVNNTAQKSPEASESTVKHHPKYALVVNFSSGGSESHTQRFLNSVFLILHSSLTVF